MAEKDTIFSSKIKYDGMFVFKDFYKFCYNWLKDETGLKEISEKKYSEKIAGDSKNIEVEWEGSKKFTDYFKFEANIKMKADGLKEVEVNQGGAKIKMNRGSVEVEFKGTLSRDYEGKFELSAFHKFLRSIYEKWVIPSRIDEYRDKILGAGDKFLTQAKAYLDLEGRS